MSQPKTPFWTRRKRRLLWAVGVLVVLDQLLFWTFVTRPAASIRTLIELTGDVQPPYFGLRPGLETTYSSWRNGDVTHIHINGMGFRDADRAVERPRGVRRIVVTGDSITFGIGVDDGEAFPQQMDRLLLEQGKRGVEIWNMGVPGYAMADHLGLLRKRILPLRPDVILLQLSRNDSAVPMPLSETFLSMMRFSGFARAWMILRFNFYRDTALFSQTFRAYVDECRRAGVRLVLAFEGLPRENEAEVTRIAGEGGIPLIQIGGEAYPKLPDDPHYNPEGNRRVAARLLPEVLASLPDPG